ncbi:hypothetical protein CS063_14090 [Sporanaerobium hydrogeniformans]|uniref:Uncharacterized protein n=1 Tax=Sporanaerobium hydrogeniformans TaxID=3072179 RepID=A0AC61D8R2_9FIRM|nr:hypothetical protein [Sporanaerobium hydrogeniformans]PHV69724.1 hypothetical protein CS063_14090 [Sporanaerobium hydrogeniformans]
MFIVKDFNDIELIKDNNQIRYQYVIEYFGYIYGQLGEGIIEKTRFSLDGGFDGNGEIYILEDIKEVRRILEIEDSRFINKLLWCYKLRDKEAWYRGQDVCECYVIGMMNKKNYSNNIIFDRSWLSEDEKIYFDKISTYTRYVEV